MNLTASMELFSYWNDLRGGTQAPVRQNIKPEKIRHLLPDLFILSDLGETSPRFRLTGTRLYLIFGKELHSTPFASLWEKGNANVMASIARDVMGHETPITLTVSGITYEEELHLSYEMLLLPLRSTHPTEPRLLGSLFPANSSHLYLHSIRALTPQTCRVIRAGSSINSLRNHG